MHYYGDAGGGLFFVGVAFFAIAFVLAKLRILTENNYSSFVQSVSTIIAAIAGIGAIVEKPLTFITIIGGASIFAIVWFTCICILGFACFLGVAKAGK
jgi:hypothetical protein